MEYNLINKTVTSGRLLYLADKATSTCVGEWITALLFYLKNIENKGDFYNGKK